MFIHYLLLKNPSKLQFFNKKTDEPKIVVHRSEVIYKKFYPGNSKRGTSFRILPGRVSVGSK
ncbi:MAG: hypothetical protein DWQ02_08440 [Bacteroidetes bacterium]|nr:MAG: hypothetical protein DWQ02_08440 [Bacteroidota bacterium]